MGHMVEASLKARGLEPVECSEDICGTDPAVAKECVCIDFTQPEAFRANYPFIAANFKAAVIGTTGWNDIKEDVIAEFEKHGTPMIYASNFSLGVNALFAALQKASAVLAGHGYTPHISETHHIHKLDAPSGTAKSLAELVGPAMGLDSAEDRPCPGNSGESRYCGVDITAVREGEVAGIHTVEFRSSADKLTFTHEAFSREGFAEGAVAAAFLTEGLHGVHEFKDLL